MSQQDTSNPSPDLYCLGCGYNLRGQSGDPRRCPECGHFSKMEELLIPAKKIQAALRQLESGAAMCGASAAATLFWVGPLMFVMFNSTSTQPPTGARIFIWAIAAMSIVSFVIGAFHFRQSSARNERWASSLAWFVSIACVIATFGMIVIVAIILSFEVLVNTWPTVPVKDLLLRITVAVLFLLPIPWLYNVAKRAIHPLQRETAARLARTRDDRDSK